uniref:Uncharacterized protein n=1 Tax=Arundo donax TaxID=35708 RepID=A0A0A9FNA6_ARUDO
MDRERPYETMGDPHQLHEECRKTQGEFAQGKGMKCRAFYFAGLGD